MQCIVNLIDIYYIQKTELFCRNTLMTIFDARIINVTI